MPHSSSPYRSAPANKREIISATEAFNHRAGILSLLPQQCGLSVAANAYRTVIMKCRFVVAVPDCATSRHDGSVSPYFSEQNVEQNVRCLPLVHMVNGHDEEIRILPQFISQRPAIWCRNCDQLRITRSVSASKFITQTALPFAFC